MSEKGTAAAKNPSDNCGGCNYNCSSKPELRDEIKLTCVTSCDPRDELNKVAQDADDSEFANPLFEYIDANVIGRDTMFYGPYGCRRVVYCDYTASGKPLKFIEEYIEHYVHSFYANTHTTTSTTSRQTTKFRHEARQIIKKCVNATEDDCVIFTGSGTTSAIHKLIHALRLEGDKAKRSVVFVGPFEHHSNILPWKETGAKIVRIKDNSSGTVNMEMLEQQLKKYKSRDFNMYVAFSAASNVTGILTDTVAVAELSHKYSAYSFWDYAAAGPYCNLDMNPIESKLGYKDAIFLSPHKFVGGPGTPGLLIAKKTVFQNPVPGGCGGGTVLFVTRDTHLYLKDIESREEGGTPAIVESIRAGMVFQLKQSVGHKVIEEREDELCRKALKVWKNNPNISILGSTSVRRLPIFSFIVYHPESGKLLHHNFVSVLLNDLYGIQARGGCACAGPYAWDLLGVSEALAQKFSLLVEGQQGEEVEVQCKEPLEILKPGFARVNLPYFMDDETVHFVLEAVDMVATHGWKILPQYRFNPNTGAWDNRKFNEERYEAPFSLNDIHYTEDGMKVTTEGNECLQPSMSLDEIASAASRVFEEAFEVNKEISTVEDRLVEFSDEKDNLVWFLQPQEAQVYLAADMLKYKPFRRTSIPFKPNRPSRRGHGVRSAVGKPSVSSIEEVQDGAVGGLFTPSEVGSPVEDKENAFFTIAEETPESLKKEKKKKKKVGLFHSFRFWGKRKKRERNLSKE